MTTKQARKYFHRNVRVGKSATTRWPLWSISYCGVHWASRYESVLLWHFLTDNDGARASHDFMRSAVGRRGMKI